MNKRKQELIEEIQVNIRTFLLRDLPFLTDIFQNCTTDQLLDVDLVKAYVTRQVDRIATKTTTEQKLAIIYECQEFVARMLKLADIAENTLGDDNEA